jgi:hypothetical protein
VSDGEVDIRKTRCNGMVWINCAGNGVSDRLLDEISYLQGPLNWWIFFYGRGAVAGWLPRQECVP